jgi:hypothetical protein
MKPCSLKPIDIVVLKKLSDVVNVVPVIAKSDSLTLEERAAFKERIKEEFAFHNLKMYPYDNDELDEEERALNAQIKNIIPFAVVGSEKSIIVDGKQVRGRQNRWGVINGKTISWAIVSSYTDSFTQSRMRTTASSSTCETSSPARTFRTSSRPPLKSTTRLSVPSSC